MFCKKCGEKINDEMGFCPKCGTVLEGSLKNGKKKKISGIILIIIMVIILAGVVIKLFGNTNNSNYAFYIKDGELHVSNSATKASQKLTKDLLTIDETDSDYEYYKTYVESNCGYLMYHAQDIIIYPDRFAECGEKGLGYSLCYAKWNGKKDVPITNKIATSVIGQYLVNSDGSKVYFKDTNDTLYVSDLTESVKIADNVEEFFLHKKSDNLEYTIKIEETYDLYMYDEKGKSKKVLDKFDYMKYQGEELNCYLKEDTLYSFNGIELKNIVSIDENTDIYVEDVDKNGNIYYSITNKEMRVTLIDTIEDDCVEVDANITQPDSQDEKYWKSWRTYGFGGTFVTEYTDEFLELQRIYKDKVKRDELREELKDEELVMRTLCYFDGEKSVKITENLNEFQLLDEKVFVYSQYEMDGKKKVLFSEMYEAIKEEEDNLWKAREYIEKNLSKRKYVVIDQKVNELITEASIYEIVLNPKGTAIYYVDNYDENYFVDLYEAKIKGSNLQEAKLVNNDIRKYLFSDDGEVLYYRDTVVHSENSIYGDLYIGEDKIDSDVYWLWDSYTENAGVYTLDETVFYLQYDSSYDSFALKQYSGKEPNIICENVKFSKGVLPLSRDNIYYIEWDKEAQSGELILLDGKDSVEIDSGVTAVFEPKNQNLE